MGIQGFYAALKKQGMPPLPTDLKNLSDCRVEIDLLGSFRSKVFSLLTDTYSPTRATEVGRIMASVLSSLLPFDPTQCCIHIDGAHNLEKQIEHASRRSELDKQQAKLDRALRKMQERSDKGKWTARSTMTEIQKTLTQIFVLTPGDKQCLGKSLAGTLQVCHCATEADICIAKVLKSSQYPTHHIVVSGDSDLLIHKDIP